MLLTRLKYLIAVAEYANFTKAAERLFVSQPTLSRQIMELEAELGAKLFVRNKNALTLTPEGKILLDEAKEIVARCDQLPKAIRQGSDSLIGTLNIGYQEFFQTGAMYNIIKSISTSNPKIEFSLARNNTAELRNNLQNEVYDAIFAVISCIDGLTDVDYIPLHEYRLQVAVPHDHWLADRDTIHIAELANATFIFLSREKVPNALDHSVNLCVKNGFSPVVAHYAKDVETAVLMTSMGKGVTFVHSSISVPNLQNVKVIDLVNETEPLYFGLAYKKNRSNPLLPTLISTARKHQAILEQDQK